MRRWFVLLFSSAGSTAIAAGTAVHAASVCAMKAAHQRSAMTRTLALATLIVLPGIACQPPGPRSGRPLAQRIVVLGDSLSVSPSVAESFPSELQRRLTDSGSSATITNAGVRGETTAGGLRRIDALLAQRPDVLILALGANDGLRGIDVAVMSRNLDEMIARSKRAGVEVLLCGMELPAVRGLPYARDFRAAFAETASRHDIPLVPSLLEGVALNPAMNGSDRIHPNAAGARKIADTVWPYLEPLVR
jgi:acyl-CoA thioesterase-1